MEKMRDLMKIVTSIGNKFPAQVFRKQGDPQQGGGKPRPYYTRNARNRLSIAVNLGDSLGAGLAPALLTLPVLGTVMR